MKLFLTLLLFLTSIYAQSIKEIEIVEDRPSINFQNIKDQEFKRAKLPRVRHEKQSYWLKVTLDPSKFSKENNYVIIFNSRFEANDFIFDVSRKKYLIENNILTIDKSNLKPIYVKLTNEDMFIDLNIEIQNYETFSKNSIFQNKLYGISYGIIFSAFLYYLAFFIFNRQKSFIYYSITQLSILILLASITADFSDRDYYIIRDLALLSFLIFSNLFTKEFLNTRKYTPHLDKVLTLMMIIYIIEKSTYVFTEIRIPTSIFLLFYLVTSIIVYSKTKFKPILFYFVGWSIIIFAFILTDIQMLLADYKFAYMGLETFLHITTPLESIILAFALSYKLKLSEDSNIEKEKLLVHQNKLASMGAMINNIAHQWRQPLTHLSYIIMNISSAFKHEKLDAQYLNKKSSEASKQLEYMSKTIDDFKNFYAPKKEKEFFNVYEATQNALNITRAILDSNRIAIEIIGNKDSCVNGYNNEYSQVILNLISNAKDAMIENNIENPLIKIAINKDLVKIEDNAGGINKKISEHIYEPYFTTKSSGTGIGLYMSKVILETHFQAKFYHKNIENGTCFYIEFTT